MRATTTATLDRWTDPPNLMRRDFAHETTIRAQVEPGRPVAARATLAKGRRSSTRERRRFGRNLDGGTSTRVQWSPNESTGPD